MLIGALVMAVAGVVVVVVAVAARSGRLRRNHVAGIRLPSTMRSDETWLAAHRAGFWPTALGGAVAVAGGVIAAVVVLARGDDGVGAGIVLGTAAVLLAGVVIGGVLGVKAARRV